MIKWDLFQGCKEGSHLQISMIYHVDSLKDKNHGMVSVDAEKASDKM